MASTPAISVEEVPPGTVREVILNGRTYAVCNARGLFYAVSGDCPHRNGPLGHGSLHDYEIVCPWHLWAFDIRTGQSEFAPDCPIATYPVSVTAGMIEIELP